MSHQLSQRAQAHSQTRSIWPSEWTALKSHLASLQESEDPAAPADIAVWQRSAGGAQGTPLRVALGSPFLHSPHHSLSITHSHYTLCLVPPCPTVGI